jgi:hypothetical protein
LLCFRLTTSIIDTILFNNEFIGTGGEKQRSMNKFYWKKYKDTDDLPILKREIIIELTTELKQAQYNSNWKRAAFLKKQIEEIEELK